MNITRIVPATVNFGIQRRLVPLKDYKGPKLELMFYEKDEIELLKNQLMQLELEARDIIRTTNVNNHLTGYQKERCKYKLFSIENSIEIIKEKIHNIKKSRYAKQKDEFFKNIK